MPFGRGDAAEACDVHFPFRLADETVAAVNVVLGGPAGDDSPDPPGSGQTPRTHVPA